MDLIDRYLTAVRLLLPLRQRDDIAAELRDVLINRREERQAALGRPLSREEDAALLREFGNPINVAGRYGGQQSVIGPELYPLYVLVAGLLTGISIVAPLAMIGGATLGFAILDRSPARANVLRVLNDWDPRELPRLPRRRRQGWPSHVAGIVAQSVFVLCWTGAIPLWRLVVPADHAGALAISFEPARAILYWPVLGLALGAIVVEGARLMGPARRRLADSLSLVLHVTVAIVASIALAAGRWAIVTGLDGAPTAEIDAVARGLNVGLEVGLICTVAAAVVAIGLDAWRLIRRDPEAG